MMDAALIYGEDVYPSCLRNGLSEDVGVKCDGAYGLWVGIASSILMGERGRIDGNRHREERC